MGIPTFTPGYPPDGFSLGQTKAVIRNNLDGTFETLAIDHIDNNGQPGGNPAGYHTVIHSVPQTVVDVGSLTINAQLFTGVPGVVTINGGLTKPIPPTQPQWFDLNPDGSIYQLTGAVRNSPGYAWMGGMLVQWNSVDLAGVWPTIPTDITFASNTPNNVAFPNACFAVLLTVQSNSGGSLTSGGIFVVQGSLSATKFTYRNNISTDAGARGFTWVAIGW